MPIIIIVAYIPDSTKKKRFSELIYDVRGMPHICVTTVMSIICQNTAVGMWVARISIDLPS